MWNRPEDCPLDEVHVLMGDEHPSGVGPLNAETILGNKPVARLPVYVPAETPLIELARAFASIGFVLRGTRDALVAEPQKFGAIDISKAIDAGTYVTPPIDDEYRERRLTEFSPL